jgi:membrane-bound lytic murein transglycosylase D
MFKKIFLTLIIIFAVGFSGLLLLNSGEQFLLNAQSSEKQIVSSASQNYRIISFDLPNELYFAGERVPMELFYVRESLERELVVNTYWHSSTLLLLKRANRWFPVIEPILAKNGVPNDFKYLSMIESNLTNARSPAGAVGFWQFLETTAKEYGMEVTKDVDDRYHVEKSTEAACRFLLKAYNKYGSWSLVAAAFNAGNRRIDGFLQEQQADSYFDLLMAEETERYLFRMIAMKMIVENPTFYGFYPEIEKLYQPLTYDIVKVNSSILNLADFSKEKGISYKLLKYFNPWMRSNQLPVNPGKSYAVKIPLEPFNLTHYQIRDSKNQE